MMDYIISASTDKGIKKTENQDSLCVKIMDTTQGPMAFAIICDGMGGLSKGEVASSTVVIAFENWLMKKFPLLCKNTLNKNIIGEQWTNLVNEQNKKIMAYGKAQGVKLGTTVVAILITNYEYYVINVGDSRVYEICNQCNQITNDQTLVAREVARGNITAEQAAVDSRRNVLLQCIGSSQTVNPEIISGKTKVNATYMLCSDGFRHEITKEEIFKMLCPEKCINAEQMKTNAQYLVELNKKRKEQDNISVALVRTF